MKYLSRSYIIKATLGAQFDFDGVPSFVTKAIPVGGSEEETFVLPYARLWNELAHISNNHLEWIIRYDYAQILSWGSLDLPVPKGSFFDVPEGWAIRLDQLTPKNTIEMVYHSMEIDYTAQGSLIPFDEESWTIGDKIIYTPHGSLEIKNAILVKQGSLVGIQFTVDGSLNLNDFSCSKGNEGSVYINTFAIMRQPYNAWLWCYAFDVKDQPCVNFCGHDDIDGFAHFYNQLKELYHL